MDENRISNKPETLYYYSFFPILDIICTLPQSPFMSFRCPVRIAWRRTSRFISDTYNAFRLIYGFLSLIFLDNFRNIIIT